MSEEVVSSEDVTVEVEVACVAWNFVKDQRCRHFDHVCLVSIVDGNGNIILSLDRRDCHANTFKSRIKSAISRKVLVGHNLAKFLRLLKLDHPLNLSKNLVYFGPFVKRFWSQKSRPSLGDIVEELLHVPVSRKSLPGTVKSAGIVLDLWNLMKIYESSGDVERVHSARFLIHGTKDVLEMVFRRVNKIRKAGSNPTGLQVTRLTEDFYERIIEVNFTSINDLCKVIGQLLKEFGSDLSTLRLLLHKKMIQSVESRRKVFNSLYQTSITVFPLPAPGSAEQVVLLKGTKQGIVKTLEMITKMMIQLEKDSPNQFYTRHSDFYDVANADSKSAPDYGGFGKRNVRPASSPSSSSHSVVKSTISPIKKLPHSVTPSVLFECVKAKLSSVATDYCNENTKIATDQGGENTKVVGSCEGGEGKCGLLELPGASGEEYEHGDKIGDQHSTVVARASPVRNKDDQRGGMVASSSHHNLDNSSGVEISDQTSVNMTVSRVVVELLEQHMDSLTVLGASVSVGEMNKDMEVVMTIAGTKDQVIQVYSQVQVVIERNSPR